MVSASRARRGIKARFVATALVTVILAGCAVGPNYKRPSIDAPEVTRGQIGPAEAAASLADAVARDEPSFGRDHGFARRGAALH